MAGGREQLESRRVDLWLVRADDPRLTARLAHLAQALLPHEQPRYQRIVVQRAKDEHLVTRVFVRRLLSRYAPVAAEAWRFGENEHGRPHIVAPALERRIDFNLSHTAGMIVCLVGLERVLGVDVEVAGRVRRGSEIADRFFSPQEAAALRALPAKQQPRRFLEYWTLKEAYIKARGMGLALPLDQFSFDLDASSEVGISFDPRLADDPSVWQFERYQPSARHQLAIALRRGSEPPLNVRQLDGLPLLLD